jgi:hypothetical protein
MSTEPSSEAWPPLPFAEWQPTRDTLHMYTQVVGKVRLALCPPEPQWAHVPLYVTTRGLTTSPVPYRGRAFAVDFDFIAHELRITVSSGEIRTLALGPRAVADFYADFMAQLRSLGIEVSYSTRPSEVPKPIHFEKDREHASYDPEQVLRFWRALVQIDAVLKEHRAAFQGRTSPVSFFWGSFDLSYSRYSGRPAEPPPGSDSIFRLAMNVEEFTAGFWPGDDRFPEPGFFSYTYPKPAGLEKKPVAPTATFWSDKLGEFLLRYDDVRRLASPRDAVLEMLDSTYRAGATLAGWDVEALEAKLGRTG